MDYNKFIEEKVLKLSSKKNYEKYPNQMKESLKEQVARYDLDIVSYNKNYYNFENISKITEPKELENKLKLEREG